MILIRCVWWVVLLVALACIELLHTLFFQIQIRIPALMLAVSAGHDSRPESMASFIRSQYTLFVPCVEILVFFFSPIHRHYGRRSLALVLNGNRTWEKENYGEG
jgi:hypothetical protein